VKTLNLIVACKDFSRSPGIGILLVLVATMQIGCHRDPRPQGSPTLVLKSASFSGDTVSKLCTCDGKNSSPALSWSAPPPGTESFALLETDMDSLFGYGFVHWVLYNLPPGKRELPEGVAKQEQLADGSQQGLNDFDDVGYVGPCPPGKSPHRYALVLYALDTKLNLPSRTSKKQVLKAMEGHVLGYGELVGRYQR
jgi:Raf kinase inhibitor-like YbhB/YbcL family protein